MKKTNISAKIVFSLVLAMLLSIIFTSCYTPNPLYGTWADNEGNTITFQPDYTFDATILDSSKEENAFQGTYSVVDNVLILHISDTHQIETEWDIRGAMLYLSWTINTKTMALTLYHIAR